MRAQESQYKSPRKNTVLNTKRTDISYLLSDIKSNQPFQHDFPINGICKALLKKRKNKRKKNKSEPLKKEM
jgi:hypothetical protein